MSQLVSESYECNTPRTILFLKTSGEETLRWPYMFLCLIIPGLDHPGPKLNVMLNPLIDELKELWNGDKLMTLIRSRNSHSRLHICHRFMILWPTVFLPDGAFMGD
jgi:hypothetical protein